MAVAELVPVSVCARVFDRVTEGEKRLLRRLAQPRGMARRSHDGHCGDLPSDLGVVPVHPHVDTRQAVFLDEPQRHVADVLLYPELVRVDAQAALARRLKGTSCPGFTRHGGTARGTR